MEKYKAIYKANGSIRMNEKSMDVFKNDITKVDTPNMIAEIMTATLSYEQDMNMKEDEREELKTNLRCIIANNINLSGERGV